MGKRNRIGMMILIPVLCFLFIGLGSAAATSLIQSPLLQPGTDINRAPIV